ncbi:universal stress protein [Pedobacter sp. AW31-3R]|uniref:universal stress protein n=1 Tax=Pedobacter sp. AW31-3R TaxID=3445781 RepID=UPI003FA16DB0
MKTIAVLTDFSERAEIAANYALGIAQHLHANILLYHSFLLPVVDPLGMPVVGAYDGLEEFQEDTEKELHKLAAKLKYNLSVSPSGPFKPTIYCKCDNGGFSDNLNLLLTDGEIILMVMGTHKKGISGFMMSNHMREVIDAVSIPVIIVPEKHPFKLIDKIAFATDMKGTDLEVLSSLTGLAKPFGAEIMLAHICADQPEDCASAKMIQHFLDEVGNVINYPSIYYRNVKEKRIEKGLNWLTNNVDFDILVMVHRNKSFWDQFFKGSNTQRMAAKLNLPLLVFPSSVRRLPVF